MNIYKKKYSLVYMASAEFQL